MKSNSAPPPSASLLALSALALAVGTANADLAVVGDFDFADDLVPAVFSPSYGDGTSTGGGVLTFDGTTVALAFVMDDAVSDKLFVRLKATRTP